MADLAKVITADLAAYYEMVRESVHKWADGLTNEQLWRKPYPYGNSIGHLILHLTGNLNYYIGARVAGTGYVRDRDRVFTDGQPPRTDEALGALDGTVAMVAATSQK